MAELHGDPVIDEWLGESGFGGEGQLLRSVEQVAALTLLSRRPDPPEFPDEVLSAWRRALAHQRLTLKNSELDFIDQARRRGWSWQDVGEAIGLPAGADVQRYRDDLADETARLHPSTTPKPYLA